MSGISGMSETDAKDGHAGRKTLHPVAMMLFIILVAIGLTYALDSGEFQRQDKLVVPGTYQVIAKERSVHTLLLPSPPKRTPEQA